MSEISDNVLRLREKIAAAAIRSGRDADAVALVAAAKLNGAARVREAIAAGVDAVGENRVQEMEQKLSESAYDGAPLHFIGHLQSNKVRNVVGKCALIESVSGVELLRAVGLRAAALGVTQDVLLEVNIGREESKSGFVPEAVADAIDLVRGAENAVRVVGLMSIPPVCGEKTEEIRFFSSMYNLFIDISAKKSDNVDIRVLSMGMSGSFETAIGEGATAVRIGTAIFGARTQ
ncbi:MAG: YggS family pyridoxal phosphate-dependent enzyme [Oscillospiraceae bacterium]|jgi:pyridoxal phosphate enzyme (YggS family)|nr:YggS family pyridoxal phosphate-dependent enzyme [Oscillospiraceae bacterium]